MIPHVCLLVSRLVNGQSSMLLSKHLFICSVVPASEGGGGAQHPAVQNHVPAQEEAHQGRGRCYRSKLQDELPFWPLVAHSMITYLVNEK